ncbi:four-carbon acid sugar kinase family protein [Rhizobium sp. SL42]|uniref:four-carbon acid sugar kinase family protein n=1 Tax=Rhizobium sp. SL42 TaxID=2806346 RepID=UPI001F17A56B|nr:four-carbon acid sugar kinase family protein [Rhizobium sp. SL42]UJW77444.1 four-carbon acid sugar kinase family protein [Rhizobium sp. SL42]
MTLKAAILADDLTGALDTGTPFVENGLKVAVAVCCEGLDKAVAAKPDVLVVNTASRALSPEEASSRVGNIAARLKAHSPDLVMKKIDSRLKGNVAVETLAVADALGRRRIVICPAIPDQQRLTRNGHVVGRGVDQPISIAALFGQTSVTICDAESVADLDRIADMQDWQTGLAVGARGLGLALAKRIGKGASGSTQPALLTLTDQTLFAFGSRDPITVSQMHQLYMQDRLAVLADAPHGQLGELDAPLRLPALLRCTGNVQDDGAMVAKRFAEGVRDVIAAGNVEMLMMGGGDTALAVLTALGIDVLFPMGEVEPGIPWFDVTLQNGKSLRCAVKSGGFGTVDSLVAVLPAKPDQKSTDSKETFIGRS